MYQSDDRCSSARGSRAYEWKTAPALITKPGPSTLSSGELGGQPEGLPSLPQACDALITSEGEPLAPTQPSLPLVSANPSLTVGRYGLVNRGETSPREFALKAVAISTQRRLFTSAALPLPNSMSAGIDWSLNLPW